jgi:hypothetical protein
MSDNASIIRVSKLDAARRQLRTAITLWFTNGDPVSVHTLAFAAYDVFHTVSKKRDPNRRDRLFDTDYIKDEYRRDWHDLIKKNAHFFKHADRDPDGVLDFNLANNEFFILFAITGRQLCGESHSHEESTLLWWMQIHKPHLLTEQGRKMVADHIPVDNLEHIRGLTKHEFFEAFRQAFLIQNRTTGSERRFSLHS